MLPKKRRIRRKEFQNIFLKGKKFNSPALLLNLAMNNNGVSGGESQFSFSVSKKVSKSAVSRNKLRRRGYSSIERLKNIKPGFQAIFSFKKGAEKYKFSQIEREIINLLSNASVLE